MLVAGLPTAGAHISLAYGAHATDYGGACQIESALLTARIWQRPASSPLRARRRLARSAARGAVGFVGYN